MKKTIQTVLVVMLAFMSWSQASNAQGLFKDLVVGSHPFDSNPAEYMTVGNEMYILTRSHSDFSSLADYQLYKTDGTPANTVLVKDSISLTTGSDVHLVANANNEIYFLVRTDVSGFNHDLWKSDGTTAGTVVVTSLNYSNTSGWLPSNFIAMGNDIYFQYGQSGGHGCELWKTDGTAAGTMEVIDLDPTYGGVEANPMIIYNGKIFFSGETTLDNFELFSSDGTAAGTTLVQEINTNLSYGSHPENFSIANNELYFSAKPGPGSGGAECLFKTDGTVVTQLTTGFNVGPITSFNNVTYFRANGHQLWTSDGTTGGTVLVLDSVMLNSGFLGANSNYMFLKKYRTIPTPPYGVTTYYRSDGTAAGTTVVSYDIGASASYDLIGNNMYKTRLDSGSYTSVGLWVTDGTPGGTIKLLNGNGTGHVHIFDNNVFFANTQTATGGELWSLNSVTTGESEFQLSKEELHTYPNPSDGHFQLNITNIQSTATVEIYNTTGQKVFTTTTDKPQTEIDISGFATGIYLVKVSDGSKIYTTKIIVQ
jgi:ELWxxDGT repeat protein